jgi:hypothetical protein
MSRVSACLQQLTTPTCMERRSLGASSEPLQLPIYVAHASRLLQRRRHIESQLTAIGAHDITFVLCADADVVGMLDPELFRCVHPQYTHTTWSPPGKARLFNGTLSLALKHRLAHADALARGLHAALVIEDDAVLPADLWDQLSQRMRSLPADASIYFVGSYSRSTNPRLTLAQSARVPGVEPPLMRRANGTTVGRPPHIIGTVAYVLLARGARHLGAQPVRAEADIDISLLTMHCGTSSNPAPCAVAAPTGQYGPAQWLVWQDEALGNQRTHGRSNSVRDKWVRACRAAKPDDQGLLRACRRFGLGGRTQPMTQPGPARGRAERGKQRGGPRLGGRTGGDGSAF